MNSPLLDVNSLCVEFHTGSRKVQAVRGISFSILPGECFSIVGESGSGKSVTALTIMDELDTTGTVTQGSITYSGLRLIDQNTPRSSWMKPKDAAMVYQYPLKFLKGDHSIFEYFSSALRQLHPRAGEKTLRGFAANLLEKVRIAKPESCLDAFPEQLSCGTCQRIRIALALVRRPRLLIADEPTTGLDVLTQKVILDMLLHVAHEQNMAVLLITHNLDTALRYSDHIGVMRYGHMLEMGSPSEIVHSPAVSYTRELFAAAPSRISRSVRA